MSCFDELTYAIYADGELPESERQAVETHLIACLACRERVVALRDEAELLGEVLHERLRPERRAAERTPGTSLALGIGPTLLIAAVVTAAIGWLLETGAPLSDRWLGPLSPRGVYEMAFDLIFLLRDEAPSALSFATAVAAMASASGLLTFLLSALLRRFPSGGAYSVALLLALVFAAPESQAHFGMHEHDDFELAAGETHDGTLFVSAENADVDGIVEGDLVVFAHSLTVRGEVRGNVLAISRTYEQTGQVAGSAHVAAIRTHVTGEIGGNFYGVGEDLTLAASSRIARDVAVAAERGVIEGSVGRDAYAGGERIELRGSVARHLRAAAEHVALLDTAHVRGDVAARLPRGNELDLASGARVDGEVSTEELVRERRSRLAKWLTLHHWALLVLHVASGLLVAGLLYWIAPDTFRTQVSTAGDLLRAVGVGFLFLVATPCALLVLGLTIVGVPLAVMGLFAYFATLYVGILAFSYLVGSTLMAPGEGIRRFLLVLLAGLTVVVLLVHLPVVGVLFRIVAMVAGAGIVTDQILRALRARRAIAA